MASAWTESGINWDDLSRTSIRDAVRELYIAVSERDFWVRHFGSGGYAKIEELAPIDYNATERHRTKDQVNFIVSALSNWLSESSAPRQIGNDTDYAKSGYRGCFIDFESGSNYEYTNYGNDSDFTGDYYPPRDRGGIRANTNIEEIQLGYNSFGKQEFGNLETLLGVDLSFIRAYDSNQSFRFTYDMMQDIFKVLNYLTFVRRVTWRNGGYSGTPAVTAISDFNVARMAQGAGSDSFNAVRDGLYNNVNCNSNPDFLTFNPALWITGYNRGTSPNWDMNSDYCTFSNFDVLGLDGATFDTDFFEHKSVIYNLDFTYDFFKDISYKSTFSLASRPLGHTIRDNAITQLTNETDGGANGNININVTPQGSWVENGFGRIVDGEIDDSVETAPSWPNSPSNDDLDGNFIEQCMPLINFNKEGFLKYYTEEAN